MPSLRNVEVLRGLRYRDFRLLFVAAMVSGFVLPMQFITQIFWVQDNYPDQQVLLVGVISAVRGTGMLSFSLFGGAIADRFERRKVLRTCETVAASTSVMIFLMMALHPFGDWTIVPVLLGIFVMAANLAVDMPARTAITPAIVGMDDLSKSLTLYAIAQQIAFPVAFLVTGQLNQHLGSAPVYALSLLAWTISLPTALFIKTRSTGVARHGVGVLANIREGLVYTRRDAVIFGVIAVLMLTQVVGMPGPGALGPVWGRTVLGLSKSEFGVIGMSWGIGSLSATLFFAARYQMVQRGWSLLSMAVIFSFAAIVYVYSRSFPLTAVANAGLGFSVIGTIVCGTAIIQQKVDEEMRGRVMGLFPLAMGMSSFIAAPLSAVGQVYSLQTVFPILEWTMVGLTVLVIVTQSALRRTKPGIREIPLAPAPAEA